MPDARMEQRHCGSMPAANVDHVRLQNERAINQSVNDATAVANVSGKTSLNLHSPPAEVTPLLCFVGLPPSSAITRHMMHLVGLLTLNMSPGLLLYPLLLSGSAGLLRWQLGACVQWDWGVSLCLPPQ